MTATPEKHFAKTEALWFIGCIKPAAPLLACVIRRVFFCRDTSVAGGKAARFQAAQQTQIFSGGVTP